MNKESVLKEEIYKCSKCGLCKSVCPVFIATKNEMFLSRGRFIVLNAFYNSSKKITKDFIKNLDVCLNCNACKNFCPSNIDSYNIFSNIKDKFNYKYSILDFSFFYKVWLNLFRIFRFLYKIFPFKSLFLGTLVDDFFAEKVLRNKRREIGEGKEKGKVVYFEGCINKFINKNDKIASLNLIEKLGFSVEKIISDCCGYPYINEGNFKKLNSNMNRILYKIPSDVNYIVCSCDSCFDTLKKAIKSFQNSNVFLSKLITLDEFLKINNFNFENIPEAVYFKPLLRTSECYIPHNSKVIKKKGLCSSMENFFILKYPKIAKEIINNSFYVDDEISDKILFSSCQLSRIGLIKSLKIKGINTTVMSYSEYVSK